MIMTKNGENVISFVNESLYIQFSESTWWIDSGATVHVANSLQGFRSTRTTLRSERHIKLRTEYKQKLKLLAMSPSS